MNNLLVLTVIADDRPGVVDVLASTIKQHNGNWLESSMSHLAGKFAGILLVEIPKSHRDNLVAALATLENSGLRIAVESATDLDKLDGDYTVISVMSNDRPGIVGEITSILASLSINVEELTTYCDNAAMSGEVLFHLRAKLQLPPELNQEDLQLNLEELSDDLIVEFEKTIDN
jgi:glycine cleavage system regulatory protein